MKVRLDTVDWKILAALQSNGRMTNVELARRAGISAPPCLRRVRALEQNGIITGYRTLIDEKELGYDLTAFAFVGLKNQTEAELLKFEEQLRAWPIVRDAWMVSGEVDFVLFCITETLRSFQNFIIETLTSAENVESVRTSLTIRQSKSEPRVPMPGQEVADPVAV
ncbi:Lrp/AsnC family transcriptional regulator [Acuticoccus sp. I52.16.1]|uniref:Lrp/AsnC family transcriptional regulator n=1 Tax=Acuticoccus sp. I52.16.1 TaxID=2928472 RepID=UPI001FD54C21|nr:Lrp/AsnC family transcriptional regulator [Acuticoccus sp. I52.16.1]UOM33692.1 Lrp/AsnC family transcriptional regulator [Acuticoccus sp. I52.16.1]